MIRRAVFLTLLVLTSTFSFADDPVMLIRCRALQTFTSNAVMTCDSGFVSYMGHCYPLATNGGVDCPDFPPFVDLIPKTVTIDTVTYTICVPDCSSVSGCESCTDGVVWSAADQACVCMSAYTASSSVSGCGCPEPLEVNPSYSPTANIVDNMGYCVIPEATCYSLGITYSVDAPPCDGPNAASDTIKITIKGPGGATLTPGDAITLDALENCRLIDGSQELVDAQGLFGPQDRAAFIVNDSGCVVVSFLRDPSQETKIDFRETGNMDIVIPACPRVYDPCSCGPLNVTDADDNVLLWFDQMTYLGNPNSMISLQMNIDMPGFIDTMTQMPFPAGPLGMTDATGLLSVPFYRTPGATTNIVLQETGPFGTITKTFMSTCPLSATACSQIVPTLGEWALIQLSLLLLIFGVVGFKFSQGKLQPVKERIE